MSTPTARHVRAQQGRGLTPTTGHVYCWPGCPWQGATSKDAAPCQSHAHSTERRHARRRRRRSGHHTGSRPSGTAPLGPGPRAVHSTCGSEWRSRGRRRPRPQTSAALRLLLQRQPGHPARRCRQLQGGRTIERRLVLQGARSVEQRGTQLVGPRRSTGGSQLVGSGGAAWVACMPERYTGSGAGAGRGRPQEGRSSWRLPAGRQTRGNGGAQRPSSRAAHTAARPHAPATCLH